MTKRLKWIDMAKGIGIILMVVGHMPSMPNIVHNWIFSFHMPLFFFLSGYMFKKKKVNVCIRNSIKKYLEPYFIYSVLFIIVDYIFFKDVNAMKESTKRFLLGQGGFDVLWFFVSMFWIQIIYNFIEETIDDEKFVRTAVIALSVVAYGFTILKIGIAFKFSTSIVSILFFATGAEFKKVEAKLANLNSYIKMLVWLAVNVSCLSIINRAGWAVLDINSQQYGNLLITYIAAISGTLFIVCLSHILESCKIMKPIIFIGENSLYFFPLTTYIPVRIVSLLELNGIIINGIGKILSKFIGFAGTAMIVQLKQGITAITRKRENG